jgi:hypothetical protein
MSKHDHERITEYRVVGRAGVQLLVVASLARAQEEATFGLLEGEAPLPIQSRTVTTTPWEDVTETNQETKGER